MNSILFQDILLSSYLKIIILIEMMNITYVVFGHWSGSGTFFKVQAPQFGPQTSRLFIKIQTFLMYYTGILNLNYSYIVSFNKFDLRVIFFVALTKHH